MKQFSVLFVCMGNICRATVDGVFHIKVEQFLMQDVVTVDSAVAHNPQRQELAVNVAQHCLKNLGLT